MTLDIPESVERALESEAARTGKSPEEVALQLIESNLQKPRRGTIDAVLPWFGAWSMTPEERARIERMIAEERLLGEDGT
jgi:hypothetical protein